MNKEKNSPEKRFSTGGVSATVWKNQGKTKVGEETSYNTISLQRRYRDKNDEWQSTNSFRINDLPKAILVLNKAYEYLVLREQADEQVDDESSMIIVEDIV
ncbi:hypothetical protein A3K72_03945 [Candidatus Woesearchaeota archaeon RBG_13_36_6]|nr:MAG: hypothetical protein A3K72_03945 [Candidatus Woesearchaeota archaeon RBG_13_36_6]